MHKQKSDLQNLELLLKFLKGDTRIPDAFRWSVSIRNKITVMEILYEEFIAQFPKCLGEINEIKQNGFGTGAEIVKLAIKYEVFLNSIYALCENISKVVHYLYRTQNLSASFRKQKSKFLEDTNIDSVYSEILQKTSWYDEVRAIRTEATHYLTGFITAHTDTEIGYVNIPKSERKDTPKNISINDVENHIKGIYGDVLDFLASFGNHFITVIEQDVPVVLPCLLVSGFIGAKKISLKEFLNDESGICYTTNLDCPLKDVCEARKNVNKS